MKKLLLLIPILLAFMSMGDTFNNVALQDVSRPEYPNSKLYIDSIGNSYAELKVLIGNGFVVPENGTVFEGYILISTDKVNLTNQDIADIHSLINYRDLQNRMQKVK